MSAEEGCVRIKMVVVGCVQGVGFRAAAQRLARRLHLKGCVRNMPDGSVEICVEGCKEIIDEFSESLKTESLGRVDQILMTDATALQPFETFEIIY